MALSKVKQQVANQFAAVLETLDEKSPLDQNILKAVHGLCKAVIDSSAAQGDDMETAVEDDVELEADGEVEGDEEVEGAEDDVDFGEEETEGEGDDELELDGDAEGDEEVAADDDEVSFDDDETAEDGVDFEDEPAPAKPSRGKPAAAAAPVEDEAVDYDGMKAQDLYNHLLERGVDQAYAKKIATAQKKDGLVKLAKNIDKLKALWIKNAIFKKPVAVIEKYVTTKMGVDQPSYGRGRSSDDKKKGILAEALAVAMKKPAA